MELPVAEFMGAGWIACVAPWVMNDPPLVVARYVFPAVDGFVIGGSRRSLSIQWGYSVQTREER